ncbi:MAG: hypothetical protein BWK80_32365 [Desulfobacteraceae bacterium IS3]|nr:MAG: hypothetical protein BWK80_32365 [Desulfobacteraceae bacterium IS3]HAO23021.1 multifunctional response regulator receiver/nitrate/sulfonate/bicarbonate ABC transporter substrate-binding protein [Desulfobacteraceae bacterium]
MSADSAIKILLVEDTPVVRKMELRVLKKIGFSDIIEADDGEQAIARLTEQEKTDLIISDWNMPKKSGYELLTWVRSQEKYRHIPFIMVTSQAEKKQSDKAYQAGATDFVSKPFEVAELKEAIDKAFGSATEQKFKEASVPRKASPGKTLLKVAHIQITDHLPLGVLKYLISHKNISPKYFELEPRCMSGWNPVRQAIESGEVDAAFVLAPIAMDLFSAGVPIRLVLLAHKNGSICVQNVRNEDGASLSEYFKGKTFYIPHLLSVHHMLANIFLSEIGLTPGLVGKDDTNVFFEVVPPIRMQEFMVKTPTASGFTVAEPMGSKAIADGEGTLLFLSGELWQNHPCCVLVIREDVIKAHEDAVYEFVHNIVQAGRFIAYTPRTSSGIGVEFLDPDKKLGLKIPVLENVLKEPMGIKTDDLFPVIEDLDIIQQYMSDKMGIGTLIDLEKFVDLRFAEAVYADLEIQRRPSLFQKPSDIVNRLISRHR